MAQVTINGRTYGLRFDLSALEAVEQEFGDMKAVFDRLKAGEGRIDAIKRMFVILANCQRGFEGEAEDVTAEALKHATFSALSRLGEAIKEALKESMRVETVNGGAADDDVHDAFLEEIEGKNGETGD